MATVKEEKPQLVDNLTKSAGFGTGIEFREGSLLIAGKTNVTVRKGQSFYPFFVSKPQQRNWFIY